MSKCNVTIKKQCHSERSEDELLSEAKNLEYKKVGVTEILRYALDDKMIGDFYFDTAPLT